MENVTRLQRDILEQLTERDKSASVRWDDARGIASTLTGALLPRDRMPGDPREVPEEVLKAFLEELGPLVGPDGHAETMRFVRLERAKRETVRIRAQQVAKGIPIHGASLVLHACLTSAPVGQI